MKYVLILFLFIGVKTHSFAQCNCQPKLMGVIANVALPTNLSLPGPITNPFNGMMVYNTATNPVKGYYYWLNGWIFASAADPVTVSINVVNSGFTGWQFGTLTTLNPTFSLYKNVTYEFSLSNNTAHPFRIATSNTVSPPSSNPAYNTGVTNQDAVNTKLSFTVPQNVPSNLFYLCTVHAAMRGSFSIIP